MQYRLYWWSRTLSLYGDFIFSITMAWLILEMFGAVGLASATSIALIFKLFGSIVLASSVNLYGSKKIMMLCDFIRFIIMLFLIALIITDFKYNFLIYILIASNAFFTGGYDSALQSFIPIINNQIKKANVELDWSKNLVRLLGYLTGGVLANFAIYIGFLIDGITFLIAGITLYFINTKDNKSYINKSKNILVFLKNLKKDYLSASYAIKTSEDLKFLFWYSIFIYTFSIPIGTLIAPLIKEGMNGNSILLSVVESSLAIGGLVGAYIVGKSKFDELTLIFLGSTLAGIASILTGWSNYPAILILSTTIYGMAISIIKIPQNILIQSKAEHLRSPVFAILQFSPTILFPIFSILAAQLANLTNIRLPFYIGGILLLLTSFSMLYSKKNINQIKNI